MFEKLPAGRYEVETCLGRDGKVEYRLKDYKKQPMINPNVLGTLFIIMVIEIPIAVGIALWLFW